MGNRAMTRGIALRRRRRRQPRSARLNSIIRAGNATMMLVLTHHAAIMGMRALKLDPRRTLAGPVGDVVSSWLRNSCLTEIVVIFVDRGLHLF
jgi:hypothetical protein